MDNSPLYEQGDFETPDDNGYKYKDGYDQLLDMEKMEFVDGCYIKTQCPALS